MTPPVQKIVVLGAGSAGLMAALALHRAFPSWQIAILHSPDVPVIGVGESTTVLFPPFLHQSLAIDAQEFFRHVQASWKLGVRFIWGDPQDTHFDYPFDQSMGSKPATLPRMPAYYCLSDNHDASRCAVLMNRGLSPCLVDKRDGRIVIQDSFGYHIDNSQLIDFLFATARQRQIEMISGHMSHVERTPQGAIKAVVLNDGQSVGGDLFLDCSGFSSQLLHGAMDIPFVDYSKVLLCDTAVVGSWSRVSPFLPFTTAETMDHGWCWQIEFADHVTRGYVFSSNACSSTQAEDELRAANPLIEDELRVVKFRSGRYEEFWSKNVAAIGNASGFTEPLEATALHLAIEQIRLVTRILAESNGHIVPELVDVANGQYRALWDEVRDFLAVHYRFNRRRNTPFWQFCREHIDLGGAHEFVELYQRAGPSSFCSTTLPGGHIFGYDGFMNLLIGQRVPTQYDDRISDDERRRWNAYREGLREQVHAALPMSVAHRMITS